MGSENEHSWSAKVKAFFAITIDGISKLTLLVVGALVVIGAASLAYNEVAPRFSTTDLPKPPVTGDTFVVAGNSDQIICEPGAPAGPFDLVATTQVDVFVKFVSQNANAKALMRAIMDSGLSDVDDHPNTTALPEAMIDVRYFDPAKRDNACRIAMMANLAGMLNVSVTFVDGIPSASNAIEVWFPVN